MEDEGEEEEEEGRCVNRTMSTITMMQMVTSEEEEEEDVTSIHSIDIHTCMRTHDHETPSPTWHGSERDEMDIREMHPIATRLRAMPVLMVHCTASVDVCFATSD